jgi:hypothetical protein
MDPNCATPTPGKFVGGHFYRITHGIWSNNCPWRQYSNIYYVHNAPNGRPEVVSVEDKNAPDYSKYVDLTAPIIRPEVSEKAFSIYPNPSNGIFTITTNQTYTGTIEIYNMLGKKVESVVFNNNIRSYEINLTHYSKGIYLVNLVSGNKKQTEKIIIE